MQSALFFAYKNVTQSLWLSVYKYELIQWVAQ